MTKQHDNPEYLDFVNALRFTEMLLSAIEDLTLCTRLYTEYPGSPAEWYEHVALLMNGWSATFMEQSRKVSSQ